MCLIKVRVDPFPTKNIERKDSPRNLKPADLLKSFQCAGDVMGNKYDSHIASYCRIITDLYLAGKILKSLKGRSWRNSGDVVYIRTKTFVIIKCM